MKKLTPLEHELLQRAGYPENVLFKDVILDIRELMDALANKK
jgi:hypothetical protein